MADDQSGNGHGCGGPTFPRPTLEQQGWSILVGPKFRIAGDDGEDLVEHLFIQEKQAPGDR